MIGCRESLAFSFPCWFVHTGFHRKVENLSRTLLYLSLLYSLFIETMVALFYWSSYVGFGYFCRIQRKETGGCNLEMTMCWVIGHLSYSRTWVTVPPWLNGEVRWLTQNQMVSTPQLRWGVGISLKKDLASQATSGMSRLLIPPITLRPPRALAPSRSSQIAMMFRQAVMGTGAITFTMEALVEIPIAHEDKPFSLPPCIIQSCAMPLVCIPSFLFLLLF